MKTYYLYLLFFLTISSSATATPYANYPVNTIPDSLLVSAHTVIRFAQQQYFVKDLGKASEKIKEVRTILNDKSNATDLRVYYDQFTKVGKIKARLYDANGQKIRDIKKEEINDYAAFDGFSIYNDLRLDEVPEKTLIALPEKSGKFSYSVKVQGNKILVLSQFKINKNLFLPTEYQALKEFYNIVVAKQSEQVVLKKI